MGGEENVKKWKANILGGSLIFKQTHCEENLEGTWVLFRTNQTPVGWFSGMFNKEKRGHPENLEGVCVGVVLRKTVGGCLPPTAKIGHGTII